MSTDNAPLSLEPSRGRSPRPAIVLPASSLSQYDDPPDRMLMGLAHLMTLVNYGLAAAWMFHAVPNMWHVGLGLLAAVVIGAVAESVLGPLLHVCLGRKSRFSEPLALWIGRGAGALAGALFAWWL